MIWKKPSEFQANKAIQQLLTSNLTISEDVYTESAKELNNKNNKLSQIMFFSLINRICTPKNEKSSLIISKFKIPFRKIYIYVVNDSELIGSLLIIIVGIVIAIAVHLYLYGSRFL